ncbi:hypothetical protein A2313_04085 [Candidatus Roizmanbacteria bacterium RIFOXYB2_FULL_41_10]|uniref:Membrane protein 6-pyruvoyl-tetrahydropterin synthase-related domain-containing protein n=1 Tax=Candidatus Roizmanbacteria bacterium RIFOXYA1_FULL_41_12 TaxID=1802082 RepID=A0A1F7K9R2_9BACT|nr:MAG: hypothetical protein A2209_03325 [Candidatus Roizmanbacteria bacterium RIFOXYA1_FULL_41_12]OGK66387.1 MAG: hypothetical protein A2377_03505 [Candidatus Roizmanbacteria bacterium RIFOXYB1_FULL_41_27]OGK71790.1 MAG: hypothetical protein A2313_04085 [Candidatus Roizmanbacteria bacterium RIFOXYB2_FULL_41_10]OGK72481.1 MAG: hypothetical protein A2403_04035 [Candidatus Roizmanbacteria bacterium RIFOXYC1_FULL_41_16]OGK75411.1 MAG: hypothetical protein A2459_01685 [Candidatus Roizmanbacteria ba
MLITKLKKQLPLLLLLFLVVMIAIANYVPGTWLTGWDNLHPEFDFALNAKRAFNSVWQEYQGLGLLSGMAHAADFFRVLFLWLMSPIIPDQFSRYFYHFLMLLLGSLGVFFFTKNWLLHKNNKHRSLLALLSASFYLLNFGTVQYFFTPFEPFSTFWGFFPWEVYVLFQYLFHPSRRHLLILAVVNLLTSAQAYVQPLFVVYASVVGLMSLGYLRTGWSVISLKKVIFAGLTILLINSYWLLPNVYFVLTKVEVTQNAMNNRMNTERFFQWSKSHGNLKDFVLLRNIPFDSSATSDQGYDYMKSWREYFTFPLVELISAVFFVLGAIGLFVRSRFRTYFLPSFILIAVGLLSQTPVVDLANQAIRQLPLVSQILRNPFTKLVVPLVFLISIGIGLFLEKIFYWLKEHALPVREILFLLFGLVIFISLPSFAGNLFSDKVRQKIPQEYFALFDFFKTQEPNRRIMNLPQDSYWGWGSYRWGTLGSGFLWYGIEQPIMDRAFDVWSTELEGYYWELVYALRVRDRQLFDQVVNKYNVGYVIYDQDYLPSDIINLLNLRKQQDLLKNSDKYRLVWHQGSVFVYEVIDSLSWLRASDRLPGSVTSPRFLNFDSVYHQVGDYYTGGKIDLFYPYASLFASRFSDEASFSVKETTNNYLFTTQIPISRYRLILPESINQRQPKQFTADKLIYNLPKKSAGSLGNMITDLDYQENQYYPNSNQGKIGNSFQTVKSDKLLTYAKNLTLDTWWTLPEASPGAYLLSIKSRKLSGFPLTLTVTSLNNQHKYLLTFLNDSSKSVTEYFVLPPFETFDQGLEIRINNHSFNNTPSVSEVSFMGLTPVPFSYLTGIRLQQIETVKSAKSKNIVINKLSYWQYQGFLPDEFSNNLILSQAFDPGWRAYLNGRELKEHVLVNNWANGWVIPEDESGEVKIIFWPQYLQFLGFGLLIITFVLISFHFGNGTNKPKNSL